MILRFLAELRRRQPLLFWGGAAFAGLAMAMLAAMPLDPRQILGIDPWVKPFKFAASIALFLWTVCWLVGERPGPPRALRTVSVAVLVAMIVEIVCIAGQSLRGTTSHFNARTPVDIAVFNVMGLMIAVNTVALARLLALFLRAQPHLAAGYLWGIRLGLFVFLVASLEGGAMIARNAHTVGAPDGGPGLPLVNWSTRAGDLRVAHFVGLHALQILPLIGAGVTRLVSAPARQRLAVAAVGIAYLAVVVGFFLRALAGRPVISL